MLYVTDSSLDTAERIQSNCEICISMKPKDKFDEEMEKITFICVQSSQQNGRCLEVKLKVYSEVCYCSAV